MASARTFIKMINQKIPSFSNLGFFVGMKLTLNQRFLLTEAMERTQTPNQI
jgi:hypothetical protein